MTKHEYAEQVCKYLNEAGYETTIEDHYRNNGSQVAIMVRTQDKKVSPIFTVGDIEQTPEEFANHIINFVPADIPTNSLEEIITDKESVLSRVHYVLVNSEMNKHREELVRKPINKTLELHYKVDISDILDGSRITLEQKHIDKIGVCLEELHERAYKNTMVKFPYELLTINEVIGLGMLPELPIYVLTNITKIYGAGTILYRGMKDVLEEQVGEETIVIPSSVHEVLVLPTYLGEKEAITAMIREINGSVVKPEEILSDRPYELIMDGALFEL